MKSEITTMMIPCRNAVVAPPRVCPNTTANLETGATRISLRKPNCLSYNIWMPNWKDVYVTMKQTIPGMMNCV